MEGPKIAFEIPIFGGLNITETAIIGWLLLFLITVLCLWLTHDMKKVPSKKQVVAEMIVTTITKLVKQTMGPKCVKFAPYMATIFIFSVFGSLIGLFGLRSMTADFNTTLTWGLMTFILITFNKIKYNGIFGYFKGFLSPIFVMAPLNLLSEIAFPLALGFRHFGNIAGGMVISSLLYQALGTASSAIGLSIPIFQVGIPAILSIYFDLFSGFMQAFIIVMLSMAFLGQACETDEK